MNLPNIKIGTRLHDRINNLYKVVIKIEPLHGESDILHSIITLKTEETGVETTVSFMVLRHYIARHYFEIVDQPVTKNSSKLFNIDDL